MTDMMTYLNLLCIAVIVVCIVDMSDFSSSVKKAISFLFTRGKLVTDNYRLHLCDCSYCITFWSGLIYLIAVSQVSFSTLYVLLLMCVFTTIIKATLQLAIDLVMSIIRAIEKHL